MEPDEISALVVERLRERYEREVPLMPDAAETVRTLAEAWPLGLASSSNRPLIDLVLELTGLATCFRVTVSSEEVGRGKPAPDVYLEAARRLGRRPVGLRRGRGLHQRNPLRRRREHDRHRRAAPGLPAGARGARARRPRGRLAGRAARTALGHALTGSLRGDSGNDFDVFLRGPLH